MQYLRPGVPARIQGPFGAFRPASDDRPQIWIAGGIGITPFIAMAAGLGDDGPLVRLYYGVPARSDASFLEELERIAARRPRLELRPLFADRGEIPNIASIEAESGPLAGKEFLICGPVAMVAALARDLEARGVPASAIHAERFDFR
jgi:predicted ferric reductase